MSVAVGIRGWLDCDWQLGVFDAQVCGHRNWI